MQSAQQLVSEIKTFMASMDSGVVRDATGIASAYSELCKHVNGRLSRCKEFLDKGLRSEAIYLAEIEPELIPTIKALEEVDVEKWDTACQEQNLERSPRVQMDVGATLEEAQQTEQRLKPLLKRLRLATLSQVTVKERLDVLRTLADMDPQNPAWAQDLKVFETARISEIHMATRNFSNTEDLVYVQSLLQEVTDPRWRLTFRPETIAAIKASVAKALIIQTKKDLSTLLPKLHDAHSSLEVDKVGDLIREWNDLLTSRGQSAPDDLMEQFKPICDWYDEQIANAQKERDMANACDDLRVALNNNAPASELRRLHGIAMQFDLAIAEELEHEYTTRITELDLAAGRKTRLKLLGAVGVVVVVAGAIGYMILRADQKSKTESWEKTIQTEMDAGHYDDATKLLDGLDASISDNAKFTEFRLEIKRRITAESQRAADFTQVMDELEKKGGAPDQAQLAKAQSLAKTPAENNRLKMFQTEIDSNFIQKMTDISRQTSALSADLLASDSAGYEVKLEGVEKQIADAKQTPGISADAQTTIEPIEKRIVAARAQLVEYNKNKQQNQVLQQQLITLGASAVSAQLYSEHLAEMAETYKDTPRAAAFKRSLKLKDVWLSYQAWDQIADDWNHSFAVSSADAAVSRLKAVTTYLEKYRDGGVALPLSPLREQLVAYADYLRHAAVAVSDNGPIKRDIHDSLTSPVYHDLTYIKTTDGTLYYCVGDGKYEEAMVGTVVFVLNSDDLKDLKRMEFKRDTIAKPKPAPHTLLAKSIMSDVEHMKDSDWSIECLLLADKIRQTPEVDPIIKVNMLRQVFLSAKTATWGIDPDLDAINRSIPQAHDESRQWMDPHDVGVKAYRTLAVAALDHMPDMKKLILTVQNKQALAFKQLSFDIVGYASLLKSTAGGDWQVVGAPSDVADGIKLFVVVTALSGSHSFREIGEVKGGVPTLDPVKSVGMDEGTLIFFMKPAPE